MILLNGTSIKSDIALRLKASLRFGVIDGSRHEKSVFENQVREAIRYIEALEKERLNNEQQ